MSDRIEKLLKAARLIAGSEYPPPTPELNGASLMRYIDMRNVYELREALEAFSVEEEK